MNFDQEFDFVIAGSGSGSLVAALYLRCQGKRVLVLEKTGLFGGSTARSGGVMWIPNNPFMTKDGVLDSPDLAAAYLDSVTAGQLDAPAATASRRKAFLEEAPKMLQFLMAQGIVFERPLSWPDYYDEHPGGSKAGRTVVAKVFNINELGDWQQRLRPSFITLPGGMAASIEDMRQLPLMRRAWSARWVLLKVVAKHLWATICRKNYVGGGAALQGRILKVALSAGVDIRMAEPVTQLLTEAGAVVGVVSERDGQRCRIRANLGVLINSGGFAHNAGMRAQYQPGTSSEWSAAAPGDTGELIEEMQNAGAALVQMDAFVGYQSTIPPEHKHAEIKPGVQGMTAAPHCILVDRTGVRYMNEGGSYMAYCRGMLKRNETIPAIPGWAIFDQQYMDTYMLAGTMPGRPKPERWYREGYLKKAGDIAGLASKIDVDPIVLSDTLVRFNQFVDDDRDTDFNRGDRAYDRWLGDPLHRPSETLGSINKAPFYAIEVVPGDVGTFGGVLTDEFARVLRDDGSVIAGLYATGVATGSVMGRLYPGAGCSIGPGFTFGYIAAKHAVSR